MALKYFQQSCDLKNQYSCSDVVGIRGKIDKNFNKIKAYSHLCNKGFYFKACGLAADLLKEDKEIEAAKNFMSADVIPTMAVVVIF